MKKIIYLLCTLLILTGCSANKEYKDTINVLNWSSYIPNEVIRDFEKQYDIKVNYSTYSSNEELLAKVSNVKEGTYDLIFPSDYMVEIMKNKNIIDKIDKSKIKNYSNIEKNFIGLNYDVNNEYSIPFLAASIVIVVNKDLVNDDIEGYNDLLNPEYKNEIVLVDDTRIIIGSALLANGYNINSTNKNELKLAENWLLDLKPNIKAFDSDSPKSFLITKEASIGLMWSAEALIAKKENKNIDIITPKEGHIVSVDNFAIMKNSQNKDSIYLFIDYILSEDVMEKIVNNYPYSSVNKNTNLKMYSNEEYGSYYYKLQKLISTGKTIENIGEHISTYDKIWSSIK